MAPNNDSINFDLLLTGIPANCNINHQTIVEQVFITIGAAKFIPHIVDIRKMGFNRNRNNDQQNQQLPQQQNFQQGQFRNLPNQQQFSQQFNS